MSSLFDLTGKHILITGASSGLGRHFAATLARAGAILTLTGRRGDELAKTVKDIEILGKAQPIVMDVRSSEQIAAAIEQAETAFGPLSGLVNNAGIAVLEPALTFSEQGWDDQIATNLTGAWTVAQTVAQRMNDNGVHGSIINITSIAARRTMVAGAPYAAAKAGLEQLTKVLAVEWAPYHIRVNALAPGLIRTAMNDDFVKTEQGQALIERIPQRRPGQPSDLDGPLLLLASDASGFMTGSVIVADGGHSVSSL